MQAVARLLGRMGGGEGLGERRNVAGVFVPEQDVKVGRIGHGSRGVIQQDTLHLGNADGFQENANNSSSANEEGNFQRRTFVHGAQTIPTAANMPTGLAGGLLGAYPSTKRVSKRTEKPRGHNISIDMNNAN